MRTLLRRPGPQQVHGVRDHDHALIEVVLALAVGSRYRSFDVYNLGRYERQWWQKEALRGADQEHRTVVLKFFRAEALPNAPSLLIHGRKATVAC